MTLPVKRPQTFRHGSRWEFHFRPLTGGVPMDMAGYTGELIILDAGGEQVARFTGIQVGAPGEFSSIELAPSEVDLIPAHASSYAIFLTPPAGPDYTESWFEGPVRVIEKGRYA